MKKNHIETNISLFDKGAKFFKEGEVVLITSYCPIWNTQFFVNLALNIAKKTQVQFFSCKYDLDTIEGFFCKTLDNYELFGKKRTLTELDQKRIKVDLLNLKLAITASKFLTYNKIWYEHISKSESASIIFIDSFDFIYLRKGWDIDKTLKKIAKYAIETNICIVINATIPFPKSDDPNNLQKLYEMPFLKRMEMQAAYFDKIITLHKDEYFGKLEDQNGKNTAGKMEITTIFSRDESWAQFYGHLGTNWKIDFENFY